MKILKIGCDMVSARKKIEARVEALMDCMMETEDERSRAIIDRMVKMENESPNLDERSFLFEEVCCEMYPDRRCICQVVWCFWLRFVFECNLCRLIIYRCSLFV